MKLFLVIVIALVIFLIAITGLRANNTAEPQVGVVGPCGNVYTVREGDTVEAIAQRCGTTVSALLSANQDALEHGTYEGLVLTIPRMTAEGIPVTGGESIASDLPAPVSEVATATSPAPVVVLVPTLPPPGAAVTPAVPVPIVTATAPVLLPVTGGDLAVAYTPHIVGSRETLNEIARKYGVSPDAILAANPSITNPDLIYAGQTILIPR